VSEFAKRSPPPSLGLDLDRPAPSHGGGVDDQLDIPAFLRRQAN
jgi:cell division protein FtsZ